MSIVTTTNEYAFSISVFITGARFVGNVAIPLGHDNETLVLLGYDNDTATSNGGGLSITSVSTDEDITNLDLVVVEESLFLRNEAAGEGGALYLFGGVMTAVYSSFIDNRAGKIRLGLRSSSSCSVHLGLRPFGSVHGCALVADCSFACCMVAAWLMFLFLLWYHATVLFLAKYILSKKACCALLRREPAYAALLLVPYVCTLIRRR